MVQDNFFKSTRGKIVESLKRRGGCTAAELASEHGLTPNAVRQHLARLEGDGLVSKSPVRRGRTKPSLLFSLTARGDKLFPRRYEALLNAVLGELRREQGGGRVTDVFRRIGERSARKYADRFAGKDVAGRVAAVTDILREQGVVADHGATADGFVIREHTCPYRETVAEHPEICSVVHSLMQQVLPSAPKQTASIARGDTMCEFHIESKPGGH